MNIVKDGHPFIFAFAIITFAVGYWGSLIWAVVPAVLMLFFIYFFTKYVLCPFFFDAQIILDTIFLL